MNAAGERDALITCASVSIAETTASVPQDQTLERCGQWRLFYREQHAIPDRSALVSAEELHLSRQLGLDRHYAIMVGGARPEPVQRV